MKVIKNIQKIALLLNDLLKGHANISMMGPGPCLISKLKNWYRQQIILKGDFDQDLALKVKELVYSEVRGKNLRVSIDVNPASMV